MRVGYVAVGVEFMSDRRPESLVEGVQGRILGKKLCVHVVQKGFDLLVEDIRDSLVAKI